MAATDRPPAADLRLYLLLTSLAYVFSDFVPYQQHIVSSVHRLSAHVVALVVIWMAARGSGRLVFRADNGSVGTAFATGAVTSRTPGRESGDRVNGGVIIDTGMSERHD